MKRIGFIVVEKCDDYEQPLGLDCSSGKPAGGILVWSYGNYAVFPDRKSANEAIQRTEHYRLAFNLRIPQKKFCVVVPVVAVEVVKE